jgi:hypothetical protein
MMQAKPPRAWLAGALLWAVLDVQAQKVQCPASVSLQIKSVAPFAPDGADGSIRGFGQVFSPRRVRLVGAEIGMVREGETAPSFALEPDDLSAKLGRRSVFSLWNGLPPAPEGVLHLVCEYEGGLLMNRPVGSRIRRCELDTGLLGSAPKAASPAKSTDKATRKDKPAVEAERASAQDQAAGYSTEVGQRRPLAKHAVLTCR